MAAEEPRVGERHTLLMVEVRESFAFRGGVYSLFYPRSPSWVRSCDSPPASRASFFSKGGVTTQPSVGWHYPAGTAMPSLVLRGVHRKQSKTSDTPPDHRTPAGTSPLAPREHDATDCTPAQMGADARGKGGGGAYDRFSDYPSPLMPLVYVLLGALSFPLYG